MMRNTFAALLLLLVGCSEQAGQRGDAEYGTPLSAQSAGSSIHPAEATGYIDAVDPEAFPPTPGDSTVR